MNRKGARYAKNCEAHKAFIGRIRVADLAKAAFPLSGNGKGKYLQSHLPSSRPLRLERSGRLQLLLTKNPSVVKFFDFFTFSVYPVYSVRGFFYLRALGVLAVQFLLTSGPLSLPIFAPCGESNLHYAKNKRNPHSILFPCG